MKKLIVILLFCVACVSSNGLYAASSQDNIKAIELSESPIVNGGVGSIAISNPVAEMTFTIYSITGQVVKTIVMPVGNAIVELPKGFYIIKCNLWSRKIVVK